MLAFLQKFTAQCELVLETGSIPEIPKKSKSKERILFFQTVLGFLKLALC